MNLSDGIFLSLTLGPLLLFIVWLGFAIRRKRHRVDRRK